MKRGVSDVQRAACLGNVARRGDERLDPRRVHERDAIKIDDDVETVPGEH